ncbi:MAG: ABC transporter permease subunit [Dehalococcoidales bacterium]
MRRFFESKGFLSILLLAALAWSVSAVDWGRPLVHPGGVAPLLQFLAALLKLEVSPSFLKMALLASWQTTAYAVAGITLAIALGFPLGIIASGVLARSQWIRRPMILSTRFLLAIFRSVHELVWALLFVVAIGLSPMTAILALAIPYGGILGRIYAEIFNDVPAEPLRALRASGCSELKVFLYGRLPMALPDMLSYTFYRLECAIRAVIIMSFVGVGGLGYYILLSLNDLLYGQTWTLLLFLIVLILVVDMWSVTLRRRLVS